MPFQRITGIRTGNPYRDPIDLRAGATLLEVALLWPNHCVFVKAPSHSRFVTSDLGPGRLHVYYDAAGRCEGVEVIASSASDPRPALICDSVDLFQPSMKGVWDALAQRGHACRVADAGFDAPGLGLSFFCENFDETLACGVDAVYIALRREGGAALH